MCGETGFKMLKWIDSERMLPKLDPCPHDGMWIM